MSRCDKKATCARKCLGAGQAMVTEGPGSLASGAAGIGSADSLADLSLGRVPPCREDLGQVCGQQGGRLEDERLDGFPPGVLKSLGLLPSAGATDESTLMVTSSIFLPWHSWRAAGRRPCRAHCCSSRRPRTACPAPGCSGWRDRRPGRQGREAEFLAVEAAATPRAVLSFSARTASIFVSRRWPCR